MRQTAVILKDIHVFVIHFCIYCLLVQLDIYLDQLDIG